MVDILLDFTPHENIWSYRINKKFLDFKHFKALDCEYHEKFI